MLISSFNIGLAILHGSALREMADVTLAVEAMEVLVFVHEHRTLIVVVGGVIRL